MYSARFLRNDTLFRPVVGEMKHYCGERAPACGSRETGAGFFLPSKVSDYSGFTCCVTTALLVKNSTANSLSAASQSSARFAMWVFMRPEPPQACDRKRSEVGRCNQRLSNRGRTAPSARYSG
jgi:hypothetical protein